MEEKIFGKIESISMQNLTKSYGKTLALKDFDLEIEGGELVILIGPSGSGKTTALKTINRLVEPDRGSVIINGHNIINYNPVELRRNIGYVIQQIGLLPHLSIKENIGLIPRIEKWDNSKIEARVKELLTLVDIPLDFADRYPHQLSGGQQQRIGLARAMVTNPHLLLMDEPFGALDPILRKQLQIEFLNLKHKLGKTIVFVTHDIEEAFKLGDRVAIMDKARLIQVGKPNQLILEPKNQFVSDLVSSHKKFLHMDNLIVKDMMIALDKRYLFESGLTTQQATSRMREDGIEMAVVLKDGKLVGIATLNKICSLKDKAMEEVAEKVVSFEPDRCLSEAIAQLKEENITLAVVAENREPVGIVTTDKLLLELV